MNPNLKRAEKEVMKYYAVPVSEFTALIDRGFKSSRYNCFHRQYDPAYVKTSNGRRIRLLSNYATSLVRNGQAFKNAMKIVESMNSSNSFTRNTSSNNTSKYSIYSTK